MKSKIINFDKKKYFFIYWIFSFLFLLIAIIILPFWKDFTFSNGKHIFFAFYGKGVLCICLALFLAIYIRFVFGKILLNLKRNNATKFALILEFIIMSLLSLFCFVLGILSLINANKIIIENKFVNELINYNHLSSVIIGITLYIRGVVGVIEAYFYDANATDVKKYPFWYLLVNIALITIGSCFIFTNRINDNIILYICFGILVLCFVFFFILGFVKKPIKVSKKSQKLVSLNESEKENVLNSEIQNENKDNDMNNQTPITLDENRNDVKEENENVNGSN